MLVISILTSPPSIIIITSMILLLCFVISIIVVTVIILVMFDMINFRLRLTIVVHTIVINLIASITIDIMCVIIFTIPRSAHDTTSPAATGDVSVQILLLVLLVLSRRPPTQSNMLDTEII